MRTYTGKVAELQADHLGRPTAWVACPPGAIPAPGQYLKAHVPALTGEVLPATLFASEISSQGFRALPPIPPEWLPGTELSLWGPLGNGFRMERTARHLGLVSLKDASRLSLLIPSALEQGADITLFADLPVPPLPASVEVAPLSALPEALSWADFLALEMTLAELPGLRSLFGLKPEQHLPCPAQALIYTAMPCAGMAECGACAVPTRRGWKLACLDGPVFDLRTLEWG